MICRVANSSNAKSAAPSLLLRLSSPLESRITLTTSMGYRQTASALVQSPPPRIIRLGTSCCALARNATSRTTCSSAAAAGSAGLAALWGCGGCAAVTGAALFLCTSNGNSQHVQCEGRPSTDAKAEQKEQGGNGEGEQYSLLQKCLAEAIGTATIVLGGCGAVCASKFSGGPPLSLPSIAASFGASVALAVYATRDVSGAHLNPAVTASLAVHDPTNCPLLDVAVPYVAAQITGATMAAGINYAAYRHGIAALHSTEAVKVGTAASSQLFNGAFHMIPNRALVKTVPGALAVEVGLTTALVFFIYALTDNTPGRTVPPEAVPALVGTVVAGLVVPGAPLTGCGMNPARDLGPRLVAATAGGLWTAAALEPGWWVYTVGPVLGGVAGGALYGATLKKDEQEH